jgi:hypothetical protein
VLWQASSCSGKTGQTSRHCRQDVHDDARATKSRQGLVPPTDDAGEVRRVGGHRVDRFAVGLRPPPRR